MPELEEVVGSQFRAPDIVDGGRAQTTAAPVTVEEHRWDAVRHELRCTFEVTFDRAYKQPVHTMFFEDPEVPLFSLGRFVARTEYEDIVPLPKDVFGAPDHLGKEGVANVEEDDADRAALTHPQLMGRRTADETGRVDRLEDAVAGRRGHRPGVVEHIGHRAQGNLGQVGRVADGDPAPGLRSGRRSARARHRSDEPSRLLHCQPRCSKVAFRLPLGPLTRPGHLRTVTFGRHPSVGDVRAHKAELWPRGPRRRSSCTLLWPILKRFTDSVR